MIWWYEKCKHPTIHPGKFLAAFSNGSLRFMAGLYIFWFYHLGSWSFFYLKWKTEQERGEWEPKWKSHMPTGNQMSQTAEKLHKSKNSRRRAEGKQKTQRGRNLQQQNRSGQVFLWLPVKLSWENSLAGFRNWLGQFSCPNQTKLSARGK